MRGRRAALALASILALGTATSQQARAQAADATKSGPAPSTDPAANQTVEVIGTAPLPGIGVPRELLPYSVQVQRRAQFEQAQADTLTDHLWRRAAGVQVNEIQGSPFQADLTYRGFRASGLIGAAQGIAVFLDGVRINEPFGDVVHWDLVPEFALRSVTLVPGANPAFGLNALGGALALVTADGRSAPGVHAELTAGSFGRRRLEATLGQRHGEGWHSYVGAMTFDERGWREHSPGRTRQMLANVGRATAGLSWRASVLAGRSTIVGNGLVPAYTIEGGALEEHLYGDENRSVIYTWPDPTRNELLHAALQGEAELAAGARLQALAYARRTRRHTLTGDVAEVLDAAQPELNAALNEATTRQRATGLAASFAARQGAHRWQLGAQFDQARTRFAQDEQAATFDAARQAVALGAPSEPRVRVQGQARHFGVYATDTWSVASGTHVTGTFRTNRSLLDNELQVADSTTGAPQSRPAEAFTYSSLNPALGIVHGLGAGIAAHLSVARNTRVPTVIELGCADPDQPCRLPAGLQSDPYLRQVRSTGVELGLRGEGWEVQAFRTDNRDDIVFGAASATGQLGYFRNFPRTRHQGLDISLSGRLGEALAYSLSASRLDATYQAADTLRQGERNVQVVPGTRIAGLPRQQAKLALDWATGGGFALGLDVQAVGSRTVQGNEDGRPSDAGASGQWLRVPGYGLLDLRASWRAATQVQLFARVRNALDRRYETYGALAQTVFDREGRFDAAGSDALFVAPGAPRSVHIGLRLDW